MDKQVTEEQRKQVVEKAAIQMLACVLSESPKKAKAELRQHGEWRTRWLGDAEKVLEAVDYFAAMDVVDLARGLLAALRECDIVPDCYFDIAALKQALAEVPHV